RQRPHRRNPARAPERLVFGTVRQELPQRSARSGNDKIPFAILRPHGPPEQGSPHLSPLQRRTGRRIPLDPVRLILGAWPKHVPPPIRSQRKPETSISRPGQTRLPERGKLQGRKSRVERPGAVHP